MQSWMSAGNSVFYNVIIKMAKGQQKLNHYRFNFNLWVEYDVYIAY